MEKLINKMFEWFKLQFENDKNIFNDGKLTEFGSMVFILACIGIVKGCFNVVKEIINEKEKK